MDGASDRIRPRRLEELSPAVRELIERVPAYREAPRHLFTYLSAHESLFPSWFRFTMTLLLRGDLTARQREIAIVRCAAMSRSDYELGQHGELARAAGVNGAELTNLIHSDGHRLPSEDQPIVTLVDEMVSTGDLSDASWATARQQFSETEVLELVMLTAYYQALADVLRVLRVPLEPGVSVPS